MIASGVGRTVRELVEVAFAAAGIEGPIERHVRVDPELVRPPSRRGSSATRRTRARVLGWEPQVSFEEMIGEMVRADIEELGS